MVTSATLVTMTANHWSIASAKAELSQLVRRAQRAPQILENRGEPVAVVVAIETYRRFEDQASRREKWLAFLELSRAVGAKAAGELELPARAPRPDPLRRRR